MKMILPQLAPLIDGKRSLASLMPLSTFASKNLNHSESGMSSNALGSKIPKLLTRISTPGYSRTNCSADDAMLRSPANPWRSPPVPDLRETTTSSTDALDRPLIITRAPSRASVVAIARPIPAVLPVTSASLSFNFRSISVPRADPAVSCSVRPDISSTGQPDPRHHEAKCVRCHPKRKSADRPDEDQPSKAPAPAGEADGTRRPRRVCHQWYPRAASS